VFTKILSRRPSFYRPDGRGSCGHGYSLERCGLQHRFLHQRFRRNRAQPFMRTRSREEDRHLPRPERLVLALAPGNMLTPRRRRPVALTNLIDEGFTPVSGNPSPNPLRTAGLVESGRSSSSSLPSSSISFASTRLADFLVVPAPGVRSPLANWWRGRQLSLVTNE
jgi:hypothetical protein